MSGFFGSDLAGVAATWVGAIATIVVLAGMFGERRLFAWSQHLLAGLVTGLLALLAIDEVVGPWLVDPLLADPVGRPELWAGLALVATAAGSPWLPRRVAAVPLSIAIAALAAFALGGAVIGTLLPQLVAAVPRSGGTVPGTVAGIAAATVTALVAWSFVHGVPRSRVGAVVGGVGRWLLLGGIGGWLGYLVLSRLVLLVDRLAFLLGDWLGIGR